MKKPDALEHLMDEAKKYAEFCMHNIGSVHPTMLAMTEEGLLNFIPSDFKDQKAKTDFTNAGRLICAAYGATSVVMILESWVRVAKKDEPPDDTPPSESMDRKEFVILLGETKGRTTHVFLPIVRTDAGGFFGFGEFDSSDFERFEGRFAEMLPPKTPGKETKELALLVLKAMGVTKTSLQSKLGNN